MTAICVMTNVYNEKYNLPIWHEYYGSQIGKENLFVLDHGSDDGSIYDVKPYNYLRLPRVKTYNEASRFTMINNMANDLLAYYDCVIYTDCDEILIPDPEKYTSLRDYVERMERDVAYAIGLNVRHLVDVEPALDPDKSILSQRTLVQFVSGMCKPLIIRAPVVWQHGFHGSDALPSFDALYLFHLRFANLDWTLSRLGVTRTVQYGDRKIPRYSRSDEKMISAEFTRMKDMKINEEFDLSGELQEIQGRYALRSRRIYAAHPPLFGDKLYRLPERFRSLL